MINVIVDAGKETLHISLEAFAPVNESQMITFTTSNTPLFLLSYISAFFYKFNNCILYISSSTRFISCNKPQVI